MDKKQGAIRICTDFHDLNCAYPKDNFPTPFSYQILDERAGSEVFSFMDGFSGYNQIQIKSKDQYKTMYICPWELFHIKRCPSALKTSKLCFSGP